MAMTWTLSAFADEASDTCEDQIASLKRADIKRVDMRNINGHNITDLPVDDACRIREQLEAAGITVAYFGSPIGKIDIADDFNRDLQRLAHLGKLRDVLGCRDVRMFSYYNKGGVSATEWRRQSLNRLRQLYERASDLGLTLAHENERLIFGDRCSEVLVLAEELRDGQTFKLIFDFDNFHQSDDGVWDNWLKLRDVTDALHLKDSNDQKQHVPVGEGSGEIRRILTDALQRGWAGPLSLEPHLTHSGTVAKTNPHGSTVETYEHLSQREKFQLAAESAIELLREINASFN